jgi:endonuclease YncB( thermonuclease family)
VRRLVAPLLGIALGIGVVTKVDASLLDLPSWAPGGASHHVAASNVARAPARAKAAPAQTLAVAGIVDGDTLTLVDGRQVRLAQVDAAEKGACYGSEATAALRRLAAGKTVTLRRPASAPKTDRYGRTVADVIVDGKSVNEALVRDGDAGWYESFASEDPDLARRLDAAEADAIKAGRGQWSACGRSGPSR